MSMMYISVAAALGALAGSSPSPGCPPSAGQCTGDGAEHALLQTSSQMQGPVGGRPRARQKLAAAHGGRGKPAKRPAAMEEVAQKDSAPERSQLWAPVQDLENAEDQMKTVIKEMHSMIAGHEVKSPIKSSELQAPVQDLESVEDQIKKVTQKMEIMKKEAMTPAARGDLGTTVTPAAAGTTITKAGVKSAVADGLMNDTLRVLHDGLGKAMRIERVNQRALHTDLGSHCPPGDCCNAKSFSTCVGLNGGECTWTDRCIKMMNPVKKEAVAPDPTGDLGTTITKAGVKAAVRDGLVNDTLHVLHKSLDEAVKKERVKRAKSLGVGVGGHCPPGECCSAKTFSTCVGLNGGECTWTDRCIKMGNPVETKCEDLGYMGSYGCGTDSECRWMYDSDNGVGKCLPK